MRIESSTLLVSETLTTLFLFQLYDPETNVERRLPSFPKGVRVSYPRTGTGVLLPLSEENNWKPEVLICGGSTLSESLGPRQVSLTLPTRLLSILEDDF